MICNLLLKTREKSHSNMLNQKNSHELLSRNTKSSYVTFLKLKMKMCLTKQICTVDYAFRASVAWLKTGFGTEVYIYTGLRDFRYREVSCTLRLHEVWFLIMADSDILADHISDRGKTERVKRKRTRTKTVRSWYKCNIEDHLSYMKRRFSGIKVTLKRRKSRQKRR